MNGGEVGGNCGSNACATLCMPALLHNSLEGSGAVVQFSFVLGVLWWRDHKVMSLLSLRLVAPAAIKDVSPC